jgi:glycosyltransferase involved in cell wall biosynthesis
MGYDTHALIENDEFVFERDRPEWEDPDYDPENPPEWVHFYKSGTRIDLALQGGGDPNLYAKLIGYDSIHTFSYSSAIAVDTSGLPFVHHTVGSFAGSTMWVRHVDWKLIVKPHRYVLVSRMRKAMKRAQRIVVSTPIEYREVIDSPFGYKIEPLPLAYDTLRAHEFAARRREDFNSDQVVRFIMPARQHWPFKGQDIVLRAFALLSPEERNRARVELFDWGQDQHRSRKLVRDLELSSLVEFRPMLKKEALWEEFGRPGVVVIDQIPKLKFHGGGLGGVARDALSAGVPVITHADPKVQTQIFMTPPPVIHSPCTIESVIARIREVMNMSLEDRVELGRQGMRWIGDECDFRSVIPKYINMHNQVGKPFSIGVC